VFTNDLVVARGWLTKASVNIGPWQNLYGIVYYAGGWRDRARELFTLSAADGWSLGEENLGYLDFQDGRLMEALYHVRTAAALQPRHSFGTREDRARFDRANQADYQNQMATIYYEMGALDLALLSAEKSYALDHSAPEIEYDFAVLKLARALATPNLAPEHLRQVVAQSRSLLSSAAAKDFNFFEVRALLGVLDALEDDCERGLPAMREALAPHPDQHRIYPLGTGTGNVHVAALRRRTFIADLPEPLRAEYQIARCLTQVTRGEGAAQ
jgi:tetratricopeptide (TPR) repeat protein